MPVNAARFRRFGTPAIMLVLACLWPMAGCEDQSSSKQTVFAVADSETEDTQSTASERAARRESAEQPDGDGQAEPKDRSAARADGTFGEAATHGPDSVGSDQPNEQDEPDQSEADDPSGQASGEVEDGEKEKDVGQEPPSRSRVQIPDFPKDMAWINTAGPLRLRDLRGRFVLLDFWTYCCINCMHVLPELKKLEKAYPEQLVVIGVHAAKFETEKGTENIKEAVLRYEIEHPVVNDAQHAIWNNLGIQSWPTIVLIDPEGFVLGYKSGEFQFEQIDAILKSTLPYYRKNKLMDETPIRFDLLTYDQKPTPLRFPGKVLADDKTDRLYIADSNHNRIVVTTLDGKLVETIGSGAIGHRDGSYDEATFDHPQGMVLDGATLYLADTENHLLRKIDLDARQVTTIAGSGQQGRNAWPGGESLIAGDALPDRFVGTPAQTAINSPWALWIHERDLYIAMAGPHQIWKMSLDESEIGPYAGNGREDIVDGPLLPGQPYAAGFSSFAQPSGLASDGQWLFVADSEGSSIRAVPFDSKEEVRTIVGTSSLPHGRLFAFGDQDGPRESAMLQHPLGVVYTDGKIYVADTYNNKIKAVDADTGAVATIAGTGQPGRDDTKTELDEPAGIAYAKGRLYVADTNNHAIRTIDLKNDNKVQTLTIEGLAPPRLAKTARKPSFPGATQTKLDVASITPAGGRIGLAVQLDLPKGWKINPLAPMAYFVEKTSESGPVDQTATGTLIKLEKPTTSFDISLPVKGTGQETIKVSMNYYYCQEGREGLCKMGSVVWTVPLNIRAGAEATLVKLPHKLLLP